MIPNLTTEQRRDNLEKAKAARQRRAAILKGVADGSYSVVDAWMKNRDLVQSWLEPICLGCDYSAIVKATVRAIALETTGGYGDPKPDFENIHEINDGDYQGTLVYVIPEVGYQPSEYWYVRVSYGSCCCCDTLQGEQMNDKESCIKGVMTLSLHIVQQMRRMGGYEV